MLRSFFLVREFSFGDGQTSFKYFCLVNIKYLKKINKRVFLKKSNNNKTICFYDINE